MDPHVRAGLRRGHMPHWIVADDLREGRLQSIELAGPAAGVMPFQAVYPAGKKCPDDGCSNGSRWVRQFLQILHTLHG